MADNLGPPKLQVDDDWKSAAKAERERLKKATAPAASAGPGPAPAAGAPALAPQGKSQAPAGKAGQARRSAGIDFNGLIQTMATQALFAMGAIPDPNTGQTVEHLEMARHYIDMLTVIEEKTQGNLTDEEHKMLGGMLYELRSRYIELATGQ